MHRTTRNKLAIFRSRFRGLPHIHGTLDPRTWRAWQVKEPVTDRVVLDHLRGRRPLGIYLLVQDHTHALAVDFDEDDANAPLDFIRRCRHYGLPAHLERSKRRGWHVWWFFGAEGVLASKGRLVATMMLEEIDQAGTEIFPRQDSLGPGESGNFIQLPLFGGLVPNNRTVFVDHENDLEPYADQWTFLERAEAVDEPRLDELIELNDLVATEAAPPPAGRRGSGRTFGLPPCMRRMLEHGVRDLQRVSCFRLAVQLKKTGLPESMAVAVLEDRASRNRPPHGRRVITPAEIRDQAKWAYRRPYSAIGCHDPAVRPFHGPDCPCVSWNSHAAAAAPRRRGGRTTQRQSKRRHHP